MGPFPATVGRIDPLSLDSIENRIKKQGGIRVGGGLGLEIKVKFAKRGGLAGRIICKSVGKKGIGKKLRIFERYKGWGGGEQMKFVIPKLPKAKKEAAKGNQIKGKDSKETCEGG